MNREKIKGKILNSQNQIKGTLVDSGSNIQGSISSKVSLNDNNHKSIQGSLRVKGNLVSSGININGEILNKGLQNGISNIKGKIISKINIDGKVSNKALQGYSAYQIAVLNGFEGTEEEWLASLKGESGRSIVDIVLTASENNIDVYTIYYSDDTISLFTVKNGEKGQKGETGQIGPTGSQGLQGPEGRGISHIDLTSRIDNIDVYTITYSDDTTSTFTIKNGIDGTEFLQELLLNQVDGEWYSLDSFSELSSPRTKVIAFFDRSLGQTYFFFGGNGETYYCLDGKIIRLSNDSFNDEWIYINNNQQRILTQDDISNMSVLKSDYDFVLVYKDPVFSILDLPQTDNKTGDIRYIESTQEMFIFNGQQWQKICGTINSDWKAKITDPGYIANKPVNVSEFINDVNYQTLSEVSQMISNATQNIEAKIEDNAIYNLYIETPNGTNIYGGNITLIAHLFKNSEEITDQYGPEYFIWSRHSSDSYGDIYWNQNHKIGTKELIITASDIIVTASFECKFEYNGISVSS